MRRFAVAQLEAQTPVVGPLRAVAGQHPGQSGELHARRIGVHLRRNGRRAQQIAGEPRQVGHRRGGPVPRGLRAAVSVVADMPSGSSTASVRYPANSMPVAASMVSASTRKPSWSRCAGFPAGPAPVVEHRQAGVCASRWRTVEPGGPAGVSSSTAPSSIGHLCRTCHQRFGHRRQRRTGDRCRRGWPARRRSRPPQPRRPGPASRRSSRARGCRSYAHRHYRRAAHLTAAQATHPTGVDSRLAEPSSFVDGCGRRAAGHRGAGSPGLGRDRR